MKDEHLVKYTEIQHIWKRRKTVICGSFSLSKLVFFCFATSLASSCEFIFIYIFHIPVKYTLREKHPNVKFFLVCIFLYWNCIQSECRKIRTRKKLCIWLPFTEWHIYKNILGRKKIIKRGLLRHEWFSHYIDI